MLCAGQEGSPYFKDKKPEALMMDLRLTFLGDSSHSWFVAADPGLHNQGFHQSHYAAACSPASRPFYTGQFRPLEWEGFQGLKQPH